MYNESKKVVVSDDAEFEISQNAYFAYLDEISKYKLLSTEEEISLFQKIQNGDNVARELFIKSNLRLVVKVAKKYFCPGYNTLLDLIQEGNLGLLKAVEGFDPLKGCKFSTYAIPQINKAIQRSSSRTGLPIELPVQKISLINKIRFFTDRFEVETGKKPTYEDIATQLNVSVENIIELMPFVSSTISLHSKVKDEVDDRELIDVFDDYYNNETNDVENTCIISEMRNEFCNIINKILNEKEAYILYSRWGISNTPVKDVASLAQELNMSKQGIRQSEERSIMKLKKYLLSLNKSLIDFV